MGLKTLVKDSAYSTLGQLARRRIPAERAILMYHSVGTDHPLGPLDVSLDAFELQLSFLKERYDIVDMREVLGEKRDRPIVALTFDDCYAHLYPDVIELLRQYGMTATFYIPAGLIGREIHTSYGVSRVMDWDAIQEIARMGFSIGSHALTHQRLTPLDAGAARTEIFESRRTLEDRLGVAVEDFAYPAGKYNSEITRLVENAGYRRAVTVNEGPVGSQASPFILPRVGIFASTSPTQFKAKLAGAGYYYNTARDRLLP